MGKLEEVQWSVVRPKYDREAKGEDIHNSDNAIIGVWNSDMIHNEKPRKDTGRE